MLPDDGPSSDLGQSADLTPAVEKPAGSSRRVAQHSWFRHSFNPFRIATLRGLAVVLPPLLTIILFVWAWNAIDRAILRPVESLAANTIVWLTDESLGNDEVQAIVAKSTSSRFTEIDGQRVFIDDSGKRFVRVQSSWIPLNVAVVVLSNPGEQLPTTAREFYLRYVQAKFLKRHLVIPAFLALFLAVLYLVGKLLAAGIGRLLYRYSEALINRLPIIRNVYSSVKQVTDFVFGDNELEYTRVVALEYPRRGIWSIGFVTGDSLLDIRNAAGEPMLTVLMPTSPMPATGFTISVPKSETIDLDMTLDQAIQFCVSGGVVVPDHQIVRSSLEGEVRRRLGTTDSTTVEPPAPNPTIHDKNIPSDA